MFAGALASRRRRQGHQRRRRASCRAPSSTRSPSSPSSTAPRASSGRSSRRTATLRSPIAKFLADDRDRGDQGDARRAGRRPAADRRRRARTTASQALGALRLELARRFDLIPDGRHDILWVVEFPMFEWNEDDERWQAMHHPFTAPTGDFDDPGSLSSRAYDLVLDGAEIGGGSIRIHQAEVQRARVRAARDRSPRRRRRASASCSTRCATARRRMAGSRWGSTGSSRCSPGATTSAR